MKKPLAAAVRSFVKDEEGVAATEYALLLGLIALGLFAVISVFGSTLRSYWNTVNNSVFTNAG